MMNSSLLPSTGNSNSCMERYVNRYVVHQQQPPPSHHPVHSQHLQAGTSSVAGAAASAVAAGYFHQPTNLHPHQHQHHHPHNHHHQQQQQQQQGQFVTLPTHSHPSQHPNPSVPVPPLAHQTATAGSHGASSNYMVGCYGTGGSVGASGWTGVPLISTAGSNRRHRKHFAGSGGVVANNNGNHYPYQHHLPLQQQQQPQQPYNLAKGTSSGPEFDENANLTRLALHAQGAPLILSNSNRYHHGHHRNHKSSSAATHQAAGSGVGSAKAVTIGSSQIPQESSTNCSTRSSAIQLPQHPGLDCNVGQRRSFDAHPTIVGAGGQPSGGVIKSYETAASLELIPPNGNTNNSPPSTVMSGSAMSSSVSSSSSSTSSTSSTTSSASTEMCLPRIIKPRKRRKKDRKPNASQCTTAGGTNGGVVSAGNGTDAGMCSVSDGASSGCGADGSLPCLESHLLNVGGGSSVHTMNNILLQHQQSSSLHCVPQSMEPLGGVPNVRDILSELSYIASHNPSVLFPERLTLELAKFLASSTSVPPARYSSIVQQQPPQQQQYSQLHSLLMQLQQHQQQVQQQQQLEHQQRVLHAQQQQLPIQHDQHQQMLMQQHHLQHYLTHAQYPLQQQQSQQDQLLPQLSAAHGSVTSPSTGSESSHNGNVTLLRSPAAGFFFPVPEKNAGFTESTSATLSHPSPSHMTTSVSLPEPASPSASSNCSCRLCDPFGRIWAFPMMRHSSCSSADGFESEGRKKNVGVIGSNRSSGATSRGAWCTTSAESPSFATLNISENADGCLSRKGSFSDSGSDSGCDLLLSRLPGLCSTEEEEEEDDDEEEENEEQVDGVSEENDSVLSSVQHDDPFAGRYRGLPWLSTIVGRQVLPSAGASSCTRKTKDDELLLMSELTKKLHETLDLVDDSCSGMNELSRNQKEGAGVMAPRSGSCSSSSSSFGLLLDSWGF